MWEAFAELSGNPSQIRVFYDLPPALQWLGLKTLPASIQPETARIGASMSAELKES